MLNKINSQMANKARTLDRSMTTEDATYSVKLNKDIFEQLKKEREDTLSSDKRFSSRRSHQARQSRMRVRPNQNGTYEQSSNINLVTMPSLVGVERWNGVPTVSHLYDNQDTLENVEKQPSAGKKTTSSSEAARIFEY